MKKILMLVNWKIEYTSCVPEGKQPPDYYVQGEPYWFFRHFKEPVQVDVVDISSFPWLERFEKKRLRFYVWQALKVIPRLHKYDLILSHGAQSGVVISLWRRIFKGKAKHVLFDIGAFNSAARQGMALKLMQKASKSLDGVIYHTSNQITYYEECFPWLIKKSKFIPFGTDSAYFNRESVDQVQNYLICVGYHKRDWDTLVQAYLCMARKLTKEQKEIPELWLLGKEKLDQGKVPDLPGNAVIRMIPFVPLEEMIEDVQRSLFCVLPLENFNYSFGQMTLLQQMALGKAVITARVPSMTDYVAEGRTGLFYEDGNVQDLCGRMLQLYTDDLLRQQLGEAAAEYVRSGYNEQKMAEQIETFFMEI